MIRNFLSQYIQAVHIPYVEAILIFLGIAVVIRIVFSIFIAWFSHRAKESENQVDDIAVAVLKTVKPPFYLVIAAILAFQTFALPSIWDTVFNYVFIATLVIQGIVAVQTLITHIARVYVESRDGVGDSNAAVDFGVLLLKIIVWVVGLLFLLSNLGVNITSLAASLGIGGIAIALALQSILEDLFSSFSIYFDKPFEVGDFIVVGDKMGTVEKIGIKTTRLRALQGEQIVIANKELTVAQVQNFKRLSERRAVMTIGVTYETSQEKMKMIPNIMKDVISSVEHVRFDRAHFHEFGDSALLFEVVYFVSSSDYNDYMDARQNIALRIKEQFEKEKIDMAFPTQTVYLKKES